METKRKNRPGRSDFRRFFAKVVVAKNGCWVWIGAQKDRGYGMFQFQRLATTAHRIAYIWFVGPVIDGWDIDHLCRHPWCVNPAHLEQVTHAENIRRAVFPDGLCRKALHPMVGDNILSVSARGKRVRTCRECKRLSELKRGVHRRRALVA